jgi:hypothetical protein
MSLIDLDDDLIVFNIGKNLFENFICKLTICL